MLLQLQGSVQLELLQRSAPSKLRLLASSRDFERIVVPPLQA
jgi:hypothetical protein